MRSCKLELCHLAYRRCGDDCAACPKLCDDEEKVVFVGAEGKVGGRATDTAAVELGLDRETLWMHRSPVW